MFKYIYIILGLILFISLVVLLVKLAKMGTHAAVIAEKTQEMEPKIEYINEKTQELATVQASIDEYNQKYVPTIKAVLSILAIYNTCKKNIKKKSKPKATLKNLRLITKPNSIESYKTLINLFK